MLNRALIAYWALLLLTTLPSGIAGRHLPARPPAKVSMQTPGLEVAAAVGGALGGALGDDTQYQERIPPPHRKVLLGVWNEVSSEDSIFGHRLLVGSSPPTCQGKCGACIPCNPIHVSIGSPHGALTQQEYYPEVWRCKCGNRLFMP